LVTPKTRDEPFVQQTGLGLLIKSSCLAPTLGVTKFIIVTDKIGSQFAVLLKFNLDVQQNHLRGQFVEQKANAELEL
jgi:hypothetical protein